MDPAKIAETLILAAALGACVFLGACGLVEEEECNPKDVRGVYVVMYEQVSGSCGEMEDGDMFLESGKDLYGSTYDLGVDYEFYAQGYASSNKCRYTWRDSLTRSNGSGWTADYRLDASDPTRLTGSMVFNAESVSGATCESAYQVWMQKQ